MLPPDILTELARRHMEEIRAAGYGPQTAEAEPANSV
jgi:hypothetical protein